MDCEAMTLMLYGVPEHYRATRDVVGGELVQLGTRGAIACTDIPAGKVGEVFVHGDCFFECPAGYTVEEGEPVAYDFSLDTFVPVGTDGGMVVGVALLTTPPDGKIVGLHLNG